MFQPECGRSTVLYQGLRKTLYLRLSSTAYQVCDLTGFAFLQLN